METGLQEPLNPRIPPHPIPILWPRKRLPRAEGNRDRGGAWGLVLTEGLVPFPKGKEEGCGKGREEGEVGRKAGKRDQEREAGKEGNKRRGSKPCAKQPKEKSK